MPKPADLVLCADCEEVYPREKAACPACTSTQAIPLSRVTDPAWTKTFVEEERVS